MKILLAPSETKREGGDKKFDLNSLSLSSKLKESRNKLLQEYIHIVTSNKIEKIKNLTGIKKEKELEKYKKDISKESAIKAIKRYTGVAFDYIDYPSLNSDAQNFIDNNVYIFSNLFGVLKANDYIPLYKIKQGETLNGTIRR